MSPLDEPHALWMINHIFLPFIFVYETGRPWLTILGVLAWELIEYIYYAMNKNYGPLFLWEGGKETAWDIWVNDVGGGVLGVLLALSFQYLSTSTNENNFWAAFRIKPTDPLCNRIFRFILLAVSFSLLAAIGWECLDSVSSLCVDGYNSFAWGIIGMLPIAIIYTCITHLPKYTYVLIVLLFAPAFIPPSVGWPPMSVIQFATIGPVAIILFAACLWDRYQQSDYKEMSNN